MAIGLLLRQRVENLRKLHAAPRRLTPIEKENLLRSLGDLPKSPVKVQFLGRDAETKQFATELK
jgi:hypothetical protein